ncbi:MAG: Uncharacterized protein FD135_3722 [Comamonadaceae bacterium]|nr:MAG: Uncharacterized protein FD135_3722 [Comamonadaceae bacterium]
MRLVGLLLRFHRAVAHVLHAQGAGNHQHFVQRLSATGFQNHAAHTRVQRQFGQLLAHGGQLVGIVHRAQFVEQLVAVGNGAARWFFDEREVFNDAKMQRLHAQNHPGQGAAQDFGIGEPGAGVEIFLVIQPDADAVGHPAAAPGPLVGRRLADGLDQQLLHLASETVALHARRTCVDDVSDAWHGERGLGHVGGQHDAATGVAVKNAILLGLAQAGKQRQHFGVAKHRLVAQVAAQVVGGLADFALAGQEHQNVAAVVHVAPQLIHRVGNRVVQVIVTRFFKRAVTLLHREHAPGDHDDRGWPFDRGKVVSKALGINGVQTALMRLVDDDGVVGFEQRVGLRFGQQNAVGHQLDRSVFAQAILKAHLEADHIAQRRV